VKLLEQRPRKEGRPTMRKTAGILVALLCVVAAFGQETTAVPTAPATPTFQVVKPLTTDLVQRAVQKGRRAKKASELCQNFDGIGPPLSAGPARGFAVSIVTPYCGVAIRAFDAKRKYEDFAADKVNVPPEDQQFVVVRATASSYLGIAFAIAGTSARYFSSVAKVVLKRGNEIIQPVKSEPEDVTFSNAYGKTEIYKGGSFSFPLSAFGSGREAVIIIIIPETDRTGDEARKMLTPEDLRRIE
jgi:hypothetical protein